MSSVADLQAQLAEYEAQLAEVNDALDVDPKSQDHLELKKDLLEMVQLTRDLLGEASAAALSKTREAPPPPPPQQQQSSGSLHVASLRQPGQVTEFGGWRVGDKCQTVYLADGLSYPAVVTSFRPAARSALVTFVGYLNQQETPIELLVRVAEKPAAVPAPPPAAPAAAPTAAVPKRKKGPVELPVILPTDKPDVVAKKQRLIKSLKREMNSEAKAKDQERKIKSWKDFQQLATKTGKEGVRTESIFAKKEAPTSEPEGAVRVRKKWRGEFERTAGEGAQQQDE